APEHNTVPVGAARRRRLLPVAAALAAVMLGGGMVAWHTLRAPVAFAGEGAGRVSVAILPFQFPAGENGTRSPTATLETDTRRAFSRAVRLAPIEIRDGVGARDPVSVGRALGARYIVKTTFSAARPDLEADVALLDTASGASVAATAIPADGMSIKFARE